MIRTLNLVLLGTSLAVLVSVYALKYSVEDIATEKSRIERRIDQQEGTLSLLEADWAFLNQPHHIAPIVTRNQAALGLEPVKPQQFGDIASLPMRPAAPDPAALDDLLSLLDAGIDPIEQLIKAN
jgi:hypothetical protein